VERSLALRLVVSSVTRAVTHLKVLPSVVPSVALAVPSTATPKTKTNTEILRFHNRLYKPQGSNLAVLLLLALGLTTHFKPK
jgi:hypothetical protein